MKAFIAYWLIGCVLVGIVLGRLATECPNDKVANVYQTVALIATWPALVVSALTAPSRPVACDRP